MASRVLTHIVGVPATCAQRDCVVDADRFGDEYGRVAARPQHRATQVLLHHRSEDESQNQRRRFTFELDEYVAPDRVRAQA